MDLLKNRADRDRQALLCYLRARLLLHSLEVKNMDKRINQSWLRTAVAALSALLVCMVVLNIARSGFFAADRSIADYADDIWHVPHR